MQQLERKMGTKITYLIQSCFAIKQRLPKHWWGYKNTQKRKDRAQKAREGRCLDQFIASSVPRCDSWVRYSGSPDLFTSRRRPCQLNSL
jgi:hypothetical protein